MPAQMISLADGPSILLDKPILLLGRHPECDIQLNSRKVSRRHCCIAQVNTYLVVRDLGSTNGIRINGVRVLEGRLKAGDELTIGNFRYQIQWDDEKASESGSNASKPPEVVVAKPALPASRRPVAASLPHTDEEDDLLESCNDPVPLGTRPVPRHADRPPPHPVRPPSDGSPIFPENVNLRSDSDQGQSASSSAH